MALTDLLFKLKGVKGGNGTFKAFCPIHGDYSLTIKEPFGGMINASCPKGCNTVAIIKEVGLDITDVTPSNFYFPEPKKQFPESVYKEILLNLIQADREAGKVISKDDLKLERETFLSLRKVS